VIFFGSFCGGWGHSKIVVEETNNGGEKPMLYLDDIKV